MMTNVNTRRATLADAELLAELNNDVQQIHADAYPNLFKQPNNFTEIVADFRRRILVDMNGFVLIIEVERQAIGYIYATVMTRAENAYTYDRKWMQVDQIAVRPNNQNKGYGQRLMQAVRDEAAAQGIKRIVLDVYEFNSNAHHFYAKMGFERVSVRMALDFT